MNVGVMLNHHAASEGKNFSIKSIVEEGKYPQRYIIMSAKLKELRLNERVF